MKKSTYLFALALGVNSVIFAQNVGINTDGSDPDTDALLHLLNTNSTALNPLIRLENQQGASVNGIELLNSGAATAAEWDLYIPSSTTDFRVSNGTTDHVTIQNDGDVGIGTTTPTATLDVDGSAIFNETGNSVDFRVEGLGEANLLFVDGSADRIGIGTATPSEELHIVAAYGHLLVEGENNGASSLVAGVSVKANHYRKAGFTIFDESNAEDFFIGRPYGSINQFDISNDGTSRIRIGSSGNVGIGTTVPDEKLDMKNGSVKFSNSNSYGVDNRMYSHWEDGNNDHQIGLEFDYYTGTGGTGTTHSRINFISNATLNTAINGTGKVTMMSVLSNGRVGIGTIWPGYTLDVAGDINYSGSLTNVSDKRYKKDINKIDNALGLIAQFDGYNYKFRKDEFPELKFDTTAQIGFIAQEIQKALPQLVSENDSGYLSVNYIKVVPILLMGMKEQQAIIEAQKKEIATEKAENESQQEEIKAQKQEIETIKAEASSAKIISIETAQKLAALEAKLNALLLLNSKGAVLTAEN